MWASDSKLKVLVIDDSEVVRLKIRELVEADPRIRLVGEAENAEDGLRLAARHDPDVVVMDLRLPGVSGIEATWQLGTRSPRSRVLVLTVSHDEDDVTDAILAGAAGYVVKGAPDEQIRAAILAVGEGERVVSPDVAAELVERTGAPAAAGAKPRRSRGGAPGALALAMLAGLVLAALVVGERVADGDATAWTWVQGALAFVIALALVRIGRLSRR